MDPRAKEPATRAAGSKTLSARPGIAIVVMLVLAVAAAVSVIALTDTTGERGSGLPEVFEYNIEGLRKIDEGLIKYRETGRIETGFERPRGVAVGPKALIYVAGDASVRIFGRRGGRVGEIALGEAPRCVAVATDGTLYVGMKDHVEVYDPSGVRRASWPPLGPDSHLTSIALSEEDVFVADAGNRIVLRFDTSGSLVNRIGEKDPDRNTPGFIVPSPYFDLAVGTDGLLRVANPGRHRVETYTFEGDLELWWGKPSTKIEGFCGCCNPAHFAMLPDGSYVTAEKGLVRVKVYDTEGNFECVVVSLEGGRGGSRSSERAETSGTVPPDVAVSQVIGAEGRVFVLDPATKAVRIFARTERGSRGRAH